MRFCLFVFGLQNATSLAFPPALDNTSRKFIHEAVKRLGLVSKSRGKGETRVNGEAAPGV